MLTCSFTQRIDCNSALNNATLVDCRCHCNYNMDTSDCTLDIFDYNLKDFDLAPRKKSLTKIALYDINNPKEKNDLEVSADGILEQPVDDDNIELNILDESSEDVGHIIFHENPESPDATSQESTDYISDNESVISNISENSSDECGDASSDCNESHVIIQNVEEPDCIFLSDLPIYKPNEESEDEL